jgi:hypothetical protein
MDRPLEITETEDVELHPARWNAPASTVMSLAIGGFSVYAAFVLLGRGDMTGLSFAALAAFLGVASIRWIRRWMSREPNIVLSSDGILDGTALGRPQLIPWTDIASVTMDDAGVTLILRADSQVRIPLGRRLLAVLARKPKRAYMLPTRALDVPSPVINAVIATHHESLLLDEVRAGRALIEPGTQASAEDPQRTSDRTPSASE